MLIASLALASLLSAPSPEETARLGELQNDTSVLCYGVAKGRKSTPVRENYLTFSDVVAEVPRGSFLLGQRVQGENKVLVLTPTATGPIGIARHSFLVEVDRAKCSGETLYAPAFDTLKGWGEPLPGGAKNPSVSGADVVLHQGCYAAKKGAVLEVERGKTPFVVGTALFAGDALDGKGVSAKLKVLDPKSGQVVGVVARNKLERVALSRCAGL